MSSVLPRAEVWVTGIGLVAPGSSGGRAEATALRARLLAPGDPLPAAAERAVADFDHTALLGAKGLRHLSRGTLCLLSAAHLALRDAGLCGAALEEAGVAAGTATAAAAIVADFDRTTLTEGPQSPNPALFPQTVWNGPASQASIRNGLRGPNLTISSGLNSGLDAVIAAARSISLGGAPLFLAGGFEELSPYFRVIFPGGSLERAPVPLCEGAAVLVLEDGRSAAARGVRPLALIPSWGSGWLPVGGGACASATEAAGSGTASDPNRAPAGASRTWRHDLPPGHGSPAPDATALVERLGCGGGFTGALAALLAVAPGGAPPGERELVTASDPCGRRSALTVARCG